MKKNNAFEGIHYACVSKSGVMHNTFRRRYNAKNWCNVKNLEMNGTDKFRIVKIEVKEL